jgi:hypothetical protein
MMTERKDRLWEFDPNILRETAQVLQRHPDFAVPTDLPDEIARLLDDLGSISVATSSANNRSIGNN